MDEETHVLCDVEIASEIFLKNNDQRRHSVRTSVYFSLVVFNHFSLPRHVSETLFCLLLKF